MRTTMGRTYEMLPVSASASRRDIMWTRLEEEADPEVAEAVLTFFSLVWVSALQRGRLVKRRAQASRTAFSCNGTDAHESRPPLALALLVQIQCQSLWTAHAAREKRFERYACHDQAPC
jgi:hypothetical protein